MIKKIYTEPTADILDLSALPLLSGSPVDEGENNKNDDDITDPSELGAKEGFWALDGE
ncbi:MAG: hypothetical protein J5932_11010 [Prevotella sp.]|nr:hypothetical protein [Prevotella sp.]